MTSEQIIKLAREAGWDITRDEANGGGKALLFVRLQAFAALVKSAAMKERETVAYEVVESTGESALHKCRHKAADYAVKRRAVACHELVRRPI